MVCLVIKINPIVTELFTRGRKLHISLVFITQFYFTVPTSIRLNSTHYFIMKIPNKWELQQIAFNHLSDIEFKDFIWIFTKNVLQKPCSFWVIDVVLASGNPSCFSKELLEKI